MRRTPTYLARYSLGAASVVLALVLAAPASAFDRDSHRMRAHGCALDKEVKDSVEDGTDETDWHYVEVASGGKLTVKVETGGELTVELTDSKGTTLSSSDSASEGAHQLSVTVKPGIYYIKIQSSKGKAPYQMLASVN